MRPITGEGTHLLTLSGRPRLVVKSSAILMLAHHFTHSWPGRVCMVCPGVGHCHWSLVTGCVLQSHMVELLKFVLYLNAKMASGFPTHPVVFEAWRELFCRCFFHVFLRVGFAASLVFQMLRCSSAGEVFSGSTLCKVASYSNSGNLVEVCSH